MFKATDLYRAVASSSICHTFNPDVLPPWTGLYLPHLLQLCYFRVSWFVAWITDTALLVSLFLVSSSLSLYSALSKCNFFLSPNLTTLLAVWETKQNRQIKKQNTKQKPKNQQTQKFQWLSLDYSLKSKFSVVPVPISLWAGLSPF